MHCGVQAIVERQYAFMRDDMVKDSASPLVKPNVYLQGTYAVRKFENGSIQTLLHKRHARKPNTHSERSRR